LIRNNRVTLPRGKAVAKSLPVKQFRQRLVLAATAMVVLASLLQVTVANAAGGGIELESPRIDTGNQKSLQRGAQVFVNNCMGCHTAGYQRYSRLAQDLGLSEEDVQNNLIFTTDESGEPTKVGALMTNAMTVEYGKQAFGVAPPNLALTARSRGVDWIYTYMKSYYLDPEKTTTGVNNLVYPGTAMPHVLWDLQGWQTPVYGEELHGSRPITALELTTPGKLSAAEYDDVIADLTNFMAYMSDPIKETRHRVGLFVMLFLFGLLAIAYLLKKEYWKDIT
jgi:ubiquinol-cytochrome c reductase cytochrome c1 subunit